MLRTIAWNVLSRLAIAASWLPRPVYFRLVTYLLQPLAGPARAAPQGPAPGDDVAAQATHSLPGGQSAPRSPLATVGAPRALVIDGFVPTPDKDAASFDVYWFMRILLGLGYDVTFVPAFTTAHAGRYTDELRLLGITCPVAPALTSVRDFIAQQSAAFDLVVVYRITVAERLMDLLRASAPKAKVIFNTVDLHFLRDQRQAEVNHQLHAFVEAKQREKQELALMGAADATVLLSAFEHDYVGVHAPRARRFYIPLASPVPGRLAPYEGRSGALFVGGFTHAPNVDAVHFLCGVIWPIVRRLLPDADLFVVGADPPAEILAHHAPERGITIAGYVRDLAELYRSVRVSVAPLRYGAGLKGKIVASLAVGVPCVTTSVGFEGMPPGGGEAITVVDDPDDFARAVATIYADPEEWLRRSDAGIAYARENFSIETITAKVSAMLADLGLPVTPSQQGH